MNSVYPTHKWTRWHFVNTELNAEEKEILKILNNYIGKPNEEYKILEPGCGKGTIAWHLSKIPNIQLHLMDISEYVIKGMHLRFGNSIGKNVFVQKGDILNMGYRENMFDLVYNSGVVEHFTENDLRICISQMARVSRGLVITFMPNSGCFPYMKIKQYMEEKGTWEWGLENPRNSLREIFEENGLMILNEFTIMHDNFVFVSYGSFIPPKMFSELMLEWKNRDKKSTDGMALVTIGVKKNEVSCGYC